MQKLLIATTNSGKFFEIKNFLKDLPVQLVSLSDVNISDDVEETGKTYKENSQIKALFYSKKSGLPAVADDGGLEIEELLGAPGIHSRRWIGHSATDEELIEHLEKVSKTLKKRTAYFRTVVSFALPDGLIFSSKGEVKGIIAKKPLVKLTEGYPYRSFFYLPEIKKYYHESELSKEEEKEYNHRYKAVRKLIPVIKKELCLI